MKETISRFYKAKIKEDTCQNSSLDKFMSVLGIISIIKNNCLYILFVKTRLCQNPYFTVLIITSSYLETLHHVQLTSENHPTCLLAKYLTKVKSKTSRSPYSCALTPFQLLSKHK